jgi:glycosyltransferase involved in cell wall biosynthesis
MRGPAGEDDETSADEGTAVKVAFVLGTTAGGTGRHVQMLVTGCAARGIPSVVAGPAETQLDFGFGAPGVQSETVQSETVQSETVQSETVQSETVQSETVQSETVQFGDRPNVRDGLAVLRLRQVLARSGADVVHAHGLRAGALAALALSLRPTAAPVPLVVTVHNAPPPSGVTAAVYQALELIVVRSATAILCVSADLEDRMRRAGARDVGRALVPSRGQAGLGTAVAGETVRSELGLGQDEGAPGRAAGGTARAEGSAGRADGGTARAEGSAGRADGGTARAGGSAEPSRRPLILAAGRLAPQKGFATLIEAARRWGDLSPVPLLAIAGSGPLHAELIAAAAPLGDAVRFLGHRDDIAALLAAADLFVLPSLWEGQPLVLQEALCAARPIVATRTGGVPDLTGEDGALLIPAGDPAELAAAVRRVLTSDALARRLADGARARARMLPSENDAVEAAVAVYRRLTTAALASGPARPENAPRNGLLAGWRVWERAQPVGGDLGGELLQQRPGVGHAGREVRLHGRERVGAGDPGAGQRRLIQGAGARHRDDRRPWRRQPGGEGDAGRGLAPQCLLVQRPLTGDHEAGPGRPRTERHQFQHDLDPRLHPRAEKSERREAEAPGGSRSGKVPEIPVQGRLGHLSPPGEALLQYRDVRRRSTLLRSVDRGRPVGPEQGIVHVAGE